MMKSFLVFVLAAFVLCGCISGPAVSKSTTGNLEVNVFAPQDMSVASAQIFVDGVFVGNVSQSRPILFLKRGARRIRVELPGTCGGRERQCRRDACVDLRKRERRRFHFHQAAAP